MIMTAYTFHEISTIVHGQGTKDVLGCAGNKQIEFSSFLDLVSRIHQYQKRNGEQNSLTQ